MVPLGQFVPLARQTAEPFTNMALEVTILADKVVARRVVPVEFVKVKVATVPETLVRLVTEPLMEVRVLAVRLLAANKLPVALV